MTGRPLSTMAAMGRRVAAVARLLVTTAAVVAGQAVLWRAGSVLPSLRPGRIGAARTFAEAEPLALAIAAVRLLTLGVGAALLAVTALGIAGRCCGAARLVGHVDRWTPGGLRRLLDRALGLGLAASIGLGTNPAGADDRQPAAATTIHRLPDAPATLRGLPDAAPAGGETPPALSLRRLPDAPPAPVPTPPDHPPPGDIAATLPAAPSTPAPSRASPTEGLPATPAAPASGHTEVVVQPGGSFWRLAEEHEVDRLGRQPTEAEIGACWQELVAVNRHRLVVPDDPDLLFPGQRLILPCP